MWPGLGLMMRIVDMVELRDIHSDAAELIADAAHAVDVLDPGASLLARRALALVYDREDRVSAELENAALLILVEVALQRAESEEALALADRAERRAARLLRDERAHALARAYRLMCECMYGDPVRALRRLVALDQDLQETTRFETADVRLFVLKHLCDAARHCRDVRHLRYAVRHGEPLARAYLGVDWMRDMPSRFFQRRGLAEAALLPVGGCVECARVALMESLNHREHTPRRDITRSMVEAERAWLLGDTGEMQRLLSTAVPRLEQAGLVRHARRGRRLLHERPLGRREPIAASRWTAPSPSKT